MSIKEDFLDYGIENDCAEIKMPQKLLKVIVNFVKEDRIKQSKLCEVSRSKCFDKQDLLRAYQAGSIESQEDSVAFGYDDLKELTENSEKWYKRYIK